MKYTEEQFIQEVELLYGKEYELISRFKGISKPILVKDKYGVLSFQSAKLLLQYKPTIMRALNKTEYFMNTLLNKYPEIHEKIKPVSEYVNARTEMLFETKFGIVSVTPDNLLAGYTPSIRSAIDRKLYFYNMLKDIYGEQYDFIITNTDRKNGRSILVCPIHGQVDIDNEYIFQGKGCPKCITLTESNVFYLLRLSNESESFYKLGISYELENGELRRYKDYRLLGYEIEELKRISFKSSRDCKDLELKLKRLIKNDTYAPQNWGYETSTECFKEDLLDIILKNL